MKTIYFKKLILTNVDGNNNKFWTITIGEDFTAHVVNGRVGYDGQTQAPKMFNDERSALAFAESKIREKERKGYKQFEDLNGGQDTKGSSSRLTLEMAASKQIRTRHAAQVQDLIKRLVAANIHSILSATTLKYDDDTGLFKTPLGIVTKQSIDDARAFLTKLTKHVQKQDFTSDEVKNLLGEYLMLIPQKVGRKLLVEDVLPDADAIDRQSSLLDDLEASIDQLAQLRSKQSTDKKVQDDEIEVPNIFNCEMNIVEDQAVIDKIVNFYESTRQSKHASYSFKVKRIYEIVIDKVQEAFEKEGRAIGNVKFLWHGTRISNILSILKGGLIIPPSNGGYTISGRMFSDGVYYSDQSTKSLNYACGYWGGSYEKNCFMFLADVAMGKEYIPSGPDSNLPKPGYDSTYAIGGRSGVQNNEMIVYKLSQGNLRYLVEFEA
jgi:poly [ADP-ribose] polymerase